MTKENFDAYMAILNDRDDTGLKPKEKPIDLRNAELSTYDEDEENGPTEDEEEDILEDSAEDTTPIESEKDPKENVEEVKEPVNEDSNIEEKPQEDSHEEVKEEEKEPEFDITDAFAIIAASLDKENENPDLDSVKFAMGYIESRLHERVNELNPEYAEDLKLLALKLSNYKVEYDKATNMERKLYMIAMGETRLYRHIEKYGGNDDTIDDMYDIVEDWYNFILDRTGFDMRDNRDIGAILYTLQELKEELPVPKNATKKKKRRK